MGIEIYEQDKYAIHVVNAKGEIKYECSARNVAEAIVKEHNKHDGEDQWHVGATVTLVSATYLLSDGDKPENYMRWHATASDKDVAMVLAKQAAVKALEAYLEKIGKTVKTSVKPTVKPSGKAVK